MKLSTVRASVLMVLVGACGSTAQPVPGDAAASGSGGGPGGGGGQAGAATGGSGGPPDAARSDASDRPPDAGSDPDGADPGDGGGTGADPNAFACLPPAEEKLIIHISRPPMVLLEVNGGDLTCGSRYHPASGADAALLDLTWSNAATGLVVVVRSSDLLPARTGTFVPFAVLISQDQDHWTGAPGKCRVVIDTSARIGEESFGLNQVRESYKVSGEVSCDEWFPASPGEILDRFEFTTRATFLRAR